MSARLAQSVEHQTFKSEPHRYLRVMGSSPISGDQHFFLSNTVKGAICRFETNFTIYQPFKFDGEVTCDIFFYLECGTSRLYDGINFVKNSPGHSLKITLV